MSESYRFHLGSHVGIWTIRYASGKWELLSEGVPGTTVEGLEVCPSRPEWLLAAVAFEGAYLSRDAGLHWERVLEGDIRDIAFDPSDDQVVYAGGGPVQVHRSTDRGLTWEPIDSVNMVAPEAQSRWSAPAVLKGQAGHVRDIFIHPNDSNLIIVAIEHGGVIRSCDGGRSWEDISEGITYVDMHTVGTPPQSKERFYVSSARGFFRSDDVAEGWTRVEEGMPWGYTEAQSYSHAWHFLEGDPPRLLVAGANGSPGFWDRPTRAEGVMLISDDEGDHWRASNEGLPSPMRWMAADLALHPGDPNVVFAGMGDEPRGFGLRPGTRGSGAIYVSRDRGDSWSPLIPDLPALEVLHAVPE